jgi:hypothetical protein
MRERKKSHLSRMHSQDDGSASSFMSLLSRFHETKVEDQFVAVKLLAFQANLHCIHCKVQIKADTFTDALTYMPIKSLLQTIVNLQTQAAGKHNSRREPH